MNLGPANHWRKAHAGVRSDGLNRAVVSADVTILTFTLVGDLGFFLVTVHPYYVTGAPFNTGGASDTFILVNYLNRHYFTPYRFS